MNVYATLAGYQQERDEAGNYQYRLDPDLESCVTFPGQPRSVNLGYGARQLIAREIELERMRR